MSQFCKTLFQQEHNGIKDYLLISILHTPRFPHSAWTLLKWKMENWNFLHIFYTPHFPHTAFSTLHTFHTLHFPLSAFSTFRIFYTSHFPHSSFSTLHTPHSALRTPHSSCSTEPVLLCYITNHLTTAPLGNSEVCFLRISMFPETSRETLRFEGNKLHCSPRDQSSSVK